MRMDWAFRSSLHGTGTSSDIPCQFSEATLLVAMFLRVCQFTNERPNIRSSSTKSTIPRTSGDSDTMPAKSDRGTSSSRKTIPGAWPTALNASTAASVSREAGRLARRPWTADLAAAIANNEKFLRAVTTHHCAFCNKGIYSEAVGQTSAIRPVARIILLYRNLLVDPEVTAFPKTSFSHCCFKR